MCEWEVWRVGEHYRVPVAHGTWSGIEKQWVVLGPYHEDRELIGFEYDHFHLDPRFVPQHIWRRHVDDFGVHNREYQGYSRQATHPLTRRRVGTADLRRTS